MFWGKKQFTTIDIGSSGIKAATFTTSNDEISLVGTAYVTLPFATIKEGKIVDPSLVANKIKELLAKLKTGIGKIIMTIPSNNIVIRNIELPLMEKAELKEAIKWESDHYLPFPVAGAVLDYLILARSEEKMTLLLVAVKKETIENYLNPLEKNSLTPLVLNVQPMALLSLLEYQGELTEAVAIIDIGAASTKVVIGDHQNIYLARSIDLAGEEFTQLLMESHQLDFLEAEAYKKEKGLEEVRGEGGVGLAPVLAEIAVTGNEHGQAISSLARNLVHEITRSLDFYAMEYRGQSINKTFITGGGSRLKGLFELLTTELDSKVIRLNPLKNLQVAKRGVNLTEELAVVLGLGISEVINNAG